MLIITVYIIVKYEEEKYLGKKSQEVCESVCSYLPSEGRCLYFKVKVQLQDGD